ncbi:NlpC/P60 family protein [Streptomyces sp. NPDC002490]|uniref:C40 family peptidase n=1 Tax=Streptomyces sp. NPDC002490 TaxID=3154416 RepID=UPI00332BC97A
MAVCLGLLLSAPGTAVAAPAPPPPPPGAVDDNGARGGATAGDGAPADVARLEDVRLRLDGLYREAARATDAFNAAEEVATTQAATIADLHERIELGQRRLERLKDRAGAAARAHYRSGGLPPGIRLTLSDDPANFLDGVERTMTDQRALHTLITRLGRTQETLRTHAANAVSHQEELTEARAEKDAARKEIRRKLAAAEELEESLAAEERARLRELEEGSQRDAQEAWLGSRAPEDGGARPGDQAAAAIAYATEQLGLPYEWGAEGPRSFDCSGLTQQAWAAAGVTVPRTSQEQWRTLRRVSEAELRPGDLIIYHADASHVGLYTGKGSIIHAPRPGRTVTVAGAGSMPILGVVRPGG